jgi:hypothetical protein
MAKAIHSGIASAGKPSFSTFNIPTNQLSPKLAGLVDHPLLSPDVQATILGLFKAHSRIALGAVMAALKDHPAPAGAALALVEAGALRIAEGLIDPDTELTLAPRPGACDPEKGMEPQPSVPDPAEPLGSNITSIPTGDLQPVIFMVSGNERRALRKEKLLQRPGFYFGLWRKSAYTGMGRNVGWRASTNKELGGADPAHHIICIAEQHNRLTVQQALVAERLFAQMVMQSGERESINALPHGAPIEPNEYDLVRLFVARAALALRRAGVLFTRLPTAALLLPPAEEPASAPLDPDTQVYAIAVAGLRAHLAEHDGGWRLLRGSQVRAEVKPSAFGPAAMARAELLHSGGLVRTGKVLTSTRDLTFSSAWAAGHFVLGQKPRSDLWKPISAQPVPGQPRR